MSDSPPAWYWIFWIGKQETAWSVKVQVPLDEARNPDTWPSTAALSQVFTVTRSVRWALCTVSMSRSSALPHLKRCMFLAVYRPYGRRKCSDRTDRYYDTSSCVVGILSVPFVPAVHLNRGTYGTGRCICGSFAGFKQPCRSRKLLRAVYCCTIRSYHIFACCCSSRGELT